MRMTFSILSFIAATIGAFEARAAKHKEPKKIIYKEGEQVFEGLLVEPESKAKASLLMIHNWMGVSTEVERQAKRYASEGYRVFAADIYGQGIRPTNPQEAAQQAGKYRNNRSLFRERLRLGLKTLLAQKGVNPKQIAALGYCFGGTGVLELARSGADLPLVLSFHGGLDSPAPADGAQIKARVVAFHGAIDPMVSETDLKAFEQELITHKVSWALVKYGKAVHSFTDINARNPDKGQAYNALADELSFSSTLEELKKLK